MEEENLIPIDELITQEDIPDNLSFLKEGLSQLFNGIFAADFQSEVSLYKDSTYYNLTLVSFKRIAIDIPGVNGMALILNPGLKPTDGTHIPISLGYSCPILKYVEKFDLKSFDFSPKSFYDILLRIARAEDWEMLANVIRLFYPWKNDPVSEFYVEYSDGDFRSPEQQFIDAFNSKNHPPTDLVLVDDPDYLVVMDNLLIQLTSNGNDFNIIEIIFSDILLNEDINITIRNVEKLFSSFIGVFSVENIKSIVIPSVFVSINDINIALEFPRKWLRLLDVNTGEPLDADDSIPEEEKRKSMLKFNVGSLQYSTETGFKFNDEGDFDFAFSEIAETGITLMIDTMKLDLSRTSNIPEADAAGYASVYTTLI